MCREACGFKSRFPHYRFAFTKLAYLNLDFTWYYLCMEKGKGCATFLLIIFLILLALIGIFLFAPELVSGYLPRPGENATVDSIV